MEHARYCGYSACLSVRERSAAVAISAGIASKQVPSLPRQEILKGN